MGSKSGPFPWVAALGVLAILIVVACGTIWAILKL